MYIKQEFKDDLPGHSAEAKGKGPGKGKWRKRAYRMESSNDDSVTGPSDEEPEV